MFLGELFAHACLPDLIKISNETVLLTGDFSVRLTMILVKDREHMLVIETNVIALKNVQQDGHNVFLHDCAVEAKLSSRVSHQGAQELEVAFTEITSILFDIDILDEALVLRVLRVLLEINSVRSAMDEAPIDVHEEQDGRVLALDDLLQVLSDLVHEL